MEKSCKHCGEVKPLEDFPRKRECKDGHINVCRPCRSKQQMMTRGPGFKEYQHKWYKENIDRARESLYSWRERNPERLRETQRRFRKANPQLMRFYSNKYNERIRRATPKWIDWEMVELIYKKCPIDHEVDHIIPIAGKNVCGLHVEHNLQYLTPEQNRKKGNSIVDMNRY